MRYLLVMLTNGRRDCLERTLKSFADHVTPKPTMAYILDDGGHSKPHDLVAPYRWDWKVETNTRSQGFCKATAKAWKYAARGHCPWVWWMEDDFEIIRHVDLRDLAQTMVYEPQVVQMTLCRDPANENEKAAGGFINLRPDTYHGRGGGGARWIEHRNFWTTNPSLFRADFAKSFPWLTRDQCEGHFGFGVKSALPDATFGIWGTGDPWCLHTGDRQGHGY